MSCFGCCEEDDIRKASKNGPFVPNNPAGNPGGFYVKEAPAKEMKTVTVQPIAVPVISVDELKEKTDNFGTNSLIGEGSYGRVYFGVLRSGRAAAIKKLDSSKQPDQEFLAQVRPLKHYLHCFAFITLQCVLLSDLDIIVAAVTLYFYRSPWYQDLRMKMLLSLLVIMLMDLFVCLPMSMLLKDLFMTFSMVSFIL